MRAKTAPQPIAGTAYDHAYCTDCEAVRPTRPAPREYRDLPKWDTADLVCAVCGAFLMRLFRAKE